MIWGQRHRDLFSHEHHFQLYHPHILGKYLPPRFSIHEMIWKQKQIYVYSKMQIRIFQMTLTMNKNVFIFGLDLSIVYAKCLNREWKLWNQSVNLNKNYLLKRTRMFSVEIPPLATVTCVSQKHNYVLFLCGMRSKSENKNYDCLQQRQQQQQQKKSDADKSTL